MIVLASILFGAALGWYRASRLSALTSDRLQWAAAHAFAFGLVGLFAAIFILRGAA
ncbi:MAG: hypothetical protein Q4F71_08875 [Paracoccus sp. (in: a-proteobacteria)]|nr:hypothetical protein [Paracoccus sp. (in: a-proteobacteria)]